MDRSIESIDGSIDRSIHLYCRGPGQEEKEEEEEEQEQSNSPCQVPSARQLLLALPHRMWPGLQLGGNQALILKFQLLLNRRLTSVATEFYFKKCFFCIWKEKSVYLEKSIFNKDWLKLDKT